MLTTLRIRNLALAEDLTVELPPGYIAVTGETGAGKSILIGALNLLLGERADRSLIRSGADSCVVEASFDVGALRAPLQAYLAEQGLEPCEAHMLFLKRTLTSGGASRQFVNGSPTTVSILARLGEWLVDMHGPHDHQSLLFPARQLAILDAFAGLGSAQATHAALLRERRDVERVMGDLVMDPAAFEQQLDLLRYQVREIEQARLELGEESRVEEDYRRACNASRLLQLVQQAIECLDGEETSLISRSGALGRCLQELVRTDPGASALAELHGQAAELLQSLHEALGRYADKAETDPGVLQCLEERLNLLQSLRRKYGATAAEILGFATEARAKLEKLERRDEELEALRGQLESVDTKLRASATDLSIQRRKAIPRLDKAVRAELADLGFKRCHFEIQLTSEDPGSSQPPGVTGYDRVEFLFSPNPGEPPRALRAIASSGEMARVMLALKTVLAVEDDVLLLVFDEVDANVGGETARVVGEKMRRIASRHQVLCITHLAPVAAEAEAHFAVSKEVRGGRSTSAVQRVEGQERLEEIARMLGGQSEGSLRHAAELLRGSRR
jgi:DNA repair protein RecN (Recombination protein N)